MTMSNIITAPSGVLREVAKPVETLDKRVLTILKDMEKSLKAAKKPQGVGLAAPQIGLSLRIFMIRPVDNGPIKTFINPEIIKFSQKTINPLTKDGVYEGCLSIPQHYAPITRSASVTVKYQAPEGNKLIDKTESFSGFPAHIVQHEMDHLNGILFIDRVLEQNTKLYKIEGEEWYEVGI
jgi:peptide deformylase